MSPCLSEDVVAAMVEGTLDGERFAVAERHISDVHDAGHYDEQLFIAMEFVEGGTLRECLARRPRGWLETLEILLRAGRGLAGAHEAGIVHRDFKPDNVLVCDDGRVLVSDFGLARTALGEEGKEEAPAEPEGPLVGTLTRTGALLGTPAYMAPSSMRGSPRTCGRTSTASA